MHSFDPLALPTRDAAIFGSGHNERSPLLGVSSTQQRRGPAINSEDDADHPNHSEYATIHHHESAKGHHAHDKKPTVATKPLSKYDMKSHMANERTFFKYLFTGLHIGSIGTLVLTFFPNNDVDKLYLVASIWCIAFGFMFWGLYGYYRRKSLMENGKFSQGDEISPHTPLLISSIFVMVILLVIGYGLWVHNKYNNGLTLNQLLMMDDQQNVQKKGRRRRRHRRRAARLAAAAAAANGTLSNSSDILAAQLNTNFTDNGIVGPEEISSFGNEDDSYEDLDNKQHIIYQTIPEPDHQNIDEQSKRPLSIAQIPFADDLLIDNKNANESHPSMPEPLAPIPQHPTKQDN